MVVMFPYSKALIVFSNNSIFATKVFTMWAVMLLSLSLVASEVEEKIRWVDHIAEKDMDIFYDRLVALVHPDSQSVLAPGVLLDNETVLTSFNPFRKHVLAGNKGAIKLYIMENRTIANWSDVSYDFIYATVGCGRQIVPLEDNKNVWHFESGKLSPLHDLMVIRLGEQVSIKEESKSKDYSFNKYSRSVNGSTQPAGPMLTSLAGAGTELGYDLKFASFGHIDGKHIKEGAKLRSHAYGAAQRVVTDCDEWLPRQWGRFICLRNEDQFPGIASGAMLFHRNRLYGVGSFLLSKGKQSILVFTDVRPYYNLIYGPCKIPQN